VRTLSSRACLRGAYNTRASAVVVRFGLSLPCARATPSTSHTSRCIALNKYAGFWVYRTHVLVATLCRQCRRFRLTTPAARHTTAAQDAAEFRTLPWTTQARDTCCLFSRGSPHRTSRAHSLHAHARWFPHTLALISNCRYARSATPRTYCPFAAFIYRLAFSHTRGCAFGTFYSLVYTVWVSLGHAHYATQRTPLSATAFAHTHTTLFSVRPFLTFTFSTPASCKPHHSPLYGLLFLLRTAFALRALPLGLPFRTRSLNSPQHLLRALLICSCVCGFAGFTLDFAVCVPHCTFLLRTLTYCRLAFLYTRPPGPLPSLCPFRVYHA